jgi:hypothetical protein
MNPNLEMHTDLTQSEQLMEEIDRIVHDHVSKKLTAQEQLSLVLHLCDAVCRNFPSN